MIALDKKCQGCTQSIDDFVFDIELEELTKHEFENSKVNVKTVKIEEGKTETMWLCPECKVYMMLDQERCFRCKNQLQYFENTKKIALDSMLISVTI